MSKRVTQWDVARLAGVSRATVSNVITDRSGGAVPISEETRRRVLAAVAELGYRPDAGARSLRSGRSRTVGLVIPDAANPHFWSVVRGVEEAVRLQGCQLVLTFTALDPERERQSLHALAERRMDGLILMLTYPGRVRSEVEALRLRGSAIVALGGTLPGHDAVFHSYAAGAAALMGHLLQLGHRRIAFIHGTARPGLGADRLQEYRRALHAADLPVEQRWIARCGTSLDEGVAAARALLSCEPRPTAVVGVNDLMAIGALQAAAQLSLRVPADLSVAGFDDIELAAHTVPPLTTVSAGGEEAGRAAAELLFARLREPERLPCRVERPTQLVIRESTGPCPAE